MLTSSGEPLERFRDVDTDERKDLADKGEALPDGSFPIANCEDLANAVQAIGRAKNPAKAKAHIRKRADALECDIELPWSTEPAFVLDTLVSSGMTARPPASYFDRQEDAGALVISEPDENGLRHTYGYAAEWGVCHIGIDGECVEAPEDPTEGYEDFHLGRTLTEDGYLNTGVITYKVKHRDAGMILSESAEQAHYDNIENAWAAVRLGQDDRGIWFSGVVLPHVPNEDIVLIEASGQVSGEWKFDALRGLQCVNIPGFPVMRSSAAYDDEGNVIALAASAHNLSGCEATLEERMAALKAAFNEGEHERFQKLRDEWNRMGA